MEWSIQQIARIAGTTSRTLRHYDDLGLVPPSSTGANGYRYYDQQALVRLQRVLLLRELGLGLPAIAEVVDGQQDAASALRVHAQWLRHERERLDRQLAAVEKTMRATEGGESLMAEDMFDGFDHTKYRDEVTERWGADAYARSDAWWRGLDAADKAQWKQRTAQLQHDWQDAAARGIAPAGAEAQQLAARHVAWLTGIPGTPAAAPGGDVAAYVTGLGDMYVADPRFAAHYGGVPGAEFVRDALRAYVAQR